MRPIIKNIITICALLTILILTSCTPITNSPLDDYDNSIIQDSVYKLTIENTEFNNGKIIQYINYNKATDRIMTFLVNEMLEKSVQSITKFENNQQQLCVEGNCAPIDYEPISIINPESLILGEFNKESYSGKISDYIELNYKFKSNSILGNINCYNIKNTNNINEININPKIQTTISGNICLLENSEIIYNATINSNLYYNNSVVILDNDIVRKINLISLNENIIQNTDLSFCHNLTTWDNCILIMSVINNNFEGCKQLEDNVQKVVCYSLIAGKNKDISNCKKLSNMDEQSKCEYLYKSSN